MTKMRCLIPIEKAKGILGCKKEVQIYLGVGRGVSSIITNIFSPFLPLYKHQTIESMSTWSIGAGGGLVVSVPGEGCDFPLKII